MPHHRPGELARGGAMPHPRGWPLPHHRPGELAPWSGGAHVALPPIGHAVRRVLARPSSCVPDGALTLTYMTPAHVPLHMLQFHMLRSQACFLDRIVTVCYGTTGINGTNCVQAPPIHTPGAKVAKYRQPAYYALIWVKWRLLHAALRHASQVLFVDSDVLLFRNPFTALRAIANHQLLYQGERMCVEDEAARSAGRPLPGCHVNGGILLLRSAALAAQVIAREPWLGSTSAAAKPPLDQDYVDEIIHAPNGRHTAGHLPARLFVGFCSWSWGYIKGNRSLWDALDPCELVAYHAHCMVSTPLKRESMERMLLKVEAADCHMPRPANAKARVLGRWGPKAPPHETRAPAGRGRKGTHK